MSYRPTSNYYIGWFFTELFKKVKGGFGAFMRDIIHTYMYINTQSE